MQIVWLSFYNGESAWDTIEEIHIPSAKIMAKVVNESVSRGAITDFLALFNDTGRVFISDIQSIEVNTGIYSSVWLMSEYGLHLLLF